MALNFLKRKSTVQLNILLNHNYRRPVTRHLTDAPNEIRSSIPRDYRESQQSSTDTLSCSPGQIEVNPELLTEQSVAQYKWEKAAQHIEKLLLEISASDNSGDLSRDRIETITEMINNNDSSAHRIRRKRPSGQNRCPEQDSSKLPLDIQELKTVSEMAKRLSAHSKIKNHSIPSED